MAAGVDLGICVAHPDDECLGFGALMAQTTESGGRVEVFIATTGEASRYRDLLPEAIGALRLRESSEALRSLGIDAPYCPGLTDGLLDRELEALTSSLESWLIRYQPTRVATYGMDGAYGHRDHLAVTQTLRSLTTRFEFELWQSVFPAGTFDDLRGYLQRRAPTLLSSAAVRTKEPQPQLVIKDAHLFALKRQALCLYRSQLNGRSVDQFLGSKAMRTLLSVESFAPMRHESSQS